MTTRPERPGRRLSDRQLWRLVAATVRPLPGRTAPADDTGGGAAAEAGSCDRPTRPSPAPLAKPRVVRDGPAPPLEPRRLYRLARGRVALEGRLDLHGMNQDGARAALAAFLLRGQAEGRRAILVITGKGVSGDGTLRRRVPQWLAEPPLRVLVAGVAEAHRRHGGEGALYVALKRKTPV